MSAWNPSVVGRLTRSSNSTLRRQLCMPAQQISPSAARRSPKSSAMVHASRKVCAIFLVFPSGSVAQSLGLAAESIRTIPYCRIFRSRSFRPIRQAFLTCVRNAARSASLPTAGGQTGATSDPARNFFEARLSASLAKSSSEESMSVCGSERNRSTPSNRTPST